MFQRAGGFDCKRNTSAVSPSKSVDVRTSHPHFSRSNMKVNYLPSNVGAKIRLQHHGPVNRDRRTTAGSQLQGNQCYRCLGRGHSPDNCHFKTEKCFSCQKEGHIQRDCRSAKQR